MKFYYLEAVEVDRQWVISVISFDVLGDGILRRTEQELCSENFRFCPLNIEGDEVVVTLAKGGGGGPFRTPSRRFAIDRLLFDDSSYLVFSQHREATARLKADLERMFFVKKRGN